MLIVTENLLPLQGEARLYQQLFTNAEAKSVFKELLTSIAWQQDSMHCFGKSIKLPRLTAWFADEGKYYQYSGIANTPQPWNHLLLDIKNYIEDITDNTFNAALLNYYRNGADSVGWHADDEKELGTNPVIASLSFGSERTFAFKHKTQAARTKKILLPPGSCLLMTGPTQHYWWHQLPKTANPVGPRVNITFRNII
jgi:alkylated DNA repair dioxygenase AlkB